MYVIYGQLYELLILMLVTLVDLLVTNSTLIISPITLYIVGYYKEY